MITLEQVMDATNYEWAYNESGIAWVEGDMKIGVEIKELPGGRVYVRNVEHDAGIELTEEELLHYGAIAIDWVQFIDYAREEDYSFRDLADALLAMNCGYGFTGSTMGLGVSLDFGAWLEIESGHYRLWTELGIEYYAATPAGCAKAWGKILTLQEQLAYVARQQARKES